MAQRARDASSAPATPTLEDVFRQEAGFVLRVVRRLGAAPSDVEDLAQKVFIVLQTRPDLLASGAPPRSVLFGVIRRVVSDYRRLKKVVRDVEPDLLPAAPEQEQALSRREVRALLDEALAGLDAKRRETLILYELEGLTIREVAELTGAPLQTTYSRLRSARAALRRHLVGKDLP